MKCWEIIELLERLAPRTCACDWDNPGLLAGRRDREVSRILLTVDVDDMAVEQAVLSGADMIVSHHPLIFRPIRRVTDEDFIGRRLISMIQADISCFAMHTNFDAAPGGMADAVAERLGITGGEPLEVMGQEGELSYGIGKVGALTKPLTEAELTRLVKERFALPYMTVYGSGLREGERISRIAVCPGSGSDMVGLALQKGAQVLITGDIGHHAGIDAAAQGLTVMDAGHYGLEYVFMDFVENYLNERLSGSVRIAKMPVVFPAVLA